MAKHVVATTEEIPAGGRKLVEVSGRAIVIFNLSGEFFALLNRCPHEGGSLCKGYQTGLVESGEPGEYRYSRRGEIIRCPWHAWEFDIRTGQSRCDPQRMKVRSYAASVMPGAQLLEEVPAATTFPVRVEGEYVLIEM